MFKITFAKYQTGTLLIITAIFSFTAACLTSVFSCLAAFFTGCLFLFCSRDYLTNFYEKLLKANIFIVFIWLITPFSTPGQIVWQYGIIKASLEGINLCILITLKSNAILMTFLSFISPIPSAELCSALVKLGCPSRLALLLLLMENNIHILFNEWKRLNTSAKLRGFMPKTNLQTYKTYAAMLAILLIKTHDRSKRVYEAMLLAGFTGSMPASASWSFKNNDILLIIIMAGCSIILIFLNLFHV